MKIITKLVIAMLVVILAGYFGSFFVMPSITIVNNSGQSLEQVEIVLPSSSLNFGSVNNSEQNTLHYTLKQQDGTYRYKFKYQNSAVISGQCGYVTKNEIHKRVTLTVNDNNQVDCITQ